MSVLAEDSQREPGNRFTFTLLINLDYCIFPVAFI